MAKNGPEKSFVVIDGDLRLLVERGEKMYVVSSLDIRGLNTQGRTIEEAIENAHDAARLLAEYRTSEIREVKAASKKSGLRGKSKAAKKPVAKNRARKNPVKA